MAPASKDPAEQRSLASLLVGVTGKLDLQGADEAVRVALDLVFDRIDARCPTTPKILMSGVARGADTVAAEAALARPGWSVVAVLPMSEALYLEDFDAPGAARLRRLLGDPRVKTVQLDPLRASRADKPVGFDELTRVGDGPHPLRSDHYEQQGLFITERCAILIAVGDADEAPDKVGGTARIVRHRLYGQLDAAACRVVACSDVLEEPPRLVDRRTGPVWIVDLAALVRNPAAPGEALLVRAADQDAPSPLSDSRATELSLGLAADLEGINQLILRIDRERWHRLEERARRVESIQGAAAAHLFRLRNAISAIQGETVERVRRSIWQLAVLSCAAILAFEVFVEWREKPWAVFGSLAYPLFVGAAVFIYWRAARRRWQRFAEDYRAVSEALRVQLVWWASGLTARGDRVERYYLRGAQGPLQHLRILIASLIDSALLQFGPASVDLSAAEAWASGQIDFFVSRIASRRREIAVVEATSWFLFVVSLGVAACLACDEAWRAWGPRPSTIAGLAQAPWIAASRLPLLLGSLATFLGLFLYAIEPVRAPNDRDSVSAKSNVVVGFAGAIAGLVLAFSIVELAQLTTKGVAREFLALAVILPVSIAGAIRYVSEKSSWSAELAGYEHALDHFRRGRSALAAVADPAADGATEYREIVRALGEGALAENENWLRSHRERPLEPMVGG